MYHCTWSGKSKGLQEGDRKEVAQLSQPGSFPDVFGQLTDPGSPRDSGKGTGQGKQSGLSDRNSFNSNT